MKQLGKILLWVLILGILAGSTACGGKENGAAEESTAVLESAVESGDSAADSSSIADSAAATTEVSADIVITENTDNGFPPVDSTLTDASVLGEWTDIKSPDKFAKITKIDSGLQYEDNDGKYTGAFKDGELTLKVSETDNAHVYFDAKSQNLILIYQGTPTRFKKKG